MDEGDALRRYVESRQIPSCEAVQTAKGTAHSVASTQRAAVSPQTIESVWGLLTHHVDGLTAEQIAVLMAQRRHQGVLRRGDALGTQQAAEILESHSAWFVRRPWPNGDDRWRHRPLRELQNRSVLLKPERFVLYEYLEQFMESVHGSDIEGTLRCRSNLVVHFRDGAAAEAVLKSQDLRCRDVAIEVDHFCPQYSYEEIVAADARPLRFDARFGHLLSAQLDTQFTMSSQLLMERLRAEDALHRRIQSADQFARLLLDAYSPHIHCHRSRDGQDWLFSAYKQFPRRMPAALQNQPISRNAKNKRYYNDILQLFESFPDGMTLSRFLAEFRRQFEYLPAVPSLTEFMKSAEQLAGRVLS